MSKKYVKIAPVEAVKILSHGGLSEYPKWIHDSIENGSLDNITDWWDIKTSHGWTSAGPGDYICHGDDKYIWPIDGKIFEKIYREVEELKEIPDTIQWKQDYLEVVRSIKKLEKKRALHPKLSDTLNKAKSLLWEEVMGGIEEEETLCGCMTCGEKRQQEKWEGLLGPSFPGWRYACEICGNKRCPHHSNHTLECTNNNEPGQPGSFFT